MDLLDRVRRTIRLHELATGETRLIVALSGGPDSTALAYLLGELAAAGELRVAGLAHFNHQLRESAQHDEEFCKRSAATLGLPLLVARDDVAERRRREKRSLEDAARAARYEFLERARTTLGADAIALGHTRDDQAETFLLRLLRGAGAKGLASMHPKRGVFVRPLIECRRRELVEYLEARRIPSLTDESNQDPAIPRNRVRAELLPLLAERFNPSIVDILADEAEVAREEWLWMEREAAEVTAKICRRTGQTWTVDAGALGRLPVALGRFVMHELMAELSHGRASFSHVEAALQLAKGSSGRFDTPGVRVERIGERVVLTGRLAGEKGRPVGPGSNLFEYSLSIPGEVHLVEAGCVVSAEPVAAAEWTDADLGSHVVAIRKDRCPGPLTVRNRRPGDRFRPPGLDGRKKLQDYFVDKRVGRSDRDVVPLVVDERDRIVWVAGHAIDAEFRVTDPAQAVIILRLKVLGGPA